MQPDRQRQRLKASLLVLDLRRFHSAASHSRLHPHDMMRKVSAPWLALLCCALAAVLTTSSLAVVWRPSDSTPGRAEEKCSRLAVRAS